MYRESLQLGLPQRVVRFLHQLLRCQEGCHTPSARSSGVACAARVQRTPPVSTLCLLWSISLLARLHAVDSRRLSSVVGPRQTLDNSPLLLHSLAVCLPYTSGMTAHQGHQGEEGSPPEGYWKL